MLNFGFKPDVFYLSGDAGGRAGAASAALAPSSRLFGLRLDEIEFRIDEFLHPGQLPGVSGVALFLRDGAATLTASSVVAAGPF